MADLRLLRLGAVLIVTLALPACSTYVRLPRIAGTVVDDATRQPVEGAEVFVAYVLARHTGFEPTSSRYARRWTTTNESGRFEFAPISFWARGSKHRSVSPLELSVLHPRYGRVFTKHARLIKGMHIKGMHSREELAHLTVEIEPQAGDLEAWKVPHRAAPTLCFGDHDEYFHCCEVIHGSRSPEVCKKW